MKKKNQPLCLQSSNIIIDDWFTIERIDTDTYAISEYKHWEETHCYLVIGTNLAVLIDTGLGVSNIKSIVETITSLPILVLITHAHWDHIGGLCHFNNIAIHQNETEWLSNKFPLPLEIVKKNLTLRPCDFPSDFIIDNYCIFHNSPSYIIHDKELIDIGNRKIQVLHTPGHSPGHCCFYEQERGFLYSGDLIYSGCLDAFYPTTNPVDFMNSVKSIQKLNIKKILPGHHLLNINPKLINNVSDAFSYLYNQNGLVQGSGVFSFNDFQIHI